jgi:redox-sensitive bicupin YhaK (pirin superfamily)
MTQTTGPLSPTVVIRRHDERFKNRLSWLDSKHSFSFSRHYEPSNTPSRSAVINNDDVVSPGTGFETHPHQDMEILTWVLQARWSTRSSTGHAGVIYPGLAERMSAGTGILHSEKNDSWRMQGGSEHTEPVHFVQMWVVPDEGAITPGYGQLDQEHVHRATRNPPPSGRHDHAARSSFRALVRPPRHCHAQGRRGPDHRRRGAIHRNGRPAGHRQAGCPATQPATVAVSGVRGWF